MAIVGLVGYRNIDVGAKVLGVLLVQEICAVVVMSTAIFAQGGATGIDFVSFTPGAFFSGAPGVAMMFAIGSFVGFEATAIYSEEAKDPRRTVPIATYVAIIVIGVLYAVASWAVVLAFGSANVAAAARADAGGLTFAAATQYVGPVAGPAMAVMLVASLFAALLAFHSAVSRYVLALARRGYAPNRFSAVHLRHGSPHAGSLLQSASDFVLVGVFALLDADPVLQLFTWMAGVAIVAILALMILTSLAIIVYFHRSGADTRLWHTRIAPILGCLGLTAIAALVIDNFDILMGGSTTIAEVFLAIVGLVFLGGVFVAAAVDGGRIGDAESPPSDADRAR